MDEYLKKYLSPSEVDGKKKKKAKKVKDGRMRIIDVDAFLQVDPNRRPNSESNSDESDPEEEIKKKLKGKAFKSTFSVVEEAKPVTGRHDSDDDARPSCERIGSSESDNSPPRQQRRRHDSSQSPVRNKKNDRSPPRKSRRHGSPAEPDDSPPRPQRGRHDSDQSPARNKRNSRSPKQSPPRKSRRRDSPPRKSRQRHDFDPSPLRGKRHDSDLSPPRRGSRHDSPPRKSRRRDDDLSPPRRHTRPVKEDLNQSPNRRGRDHGKTVSGRKIKEEPASPSTYRDGKKSKHSGLLSREDMRQRANEADQHEVFTNDELSGRYAEAVHRDSNYGKKKRQTKEDKERNARQQEAQKKLNEHYARVSKGLVQAEEREKKKREMEETVQEGFTRHADDEALNEHLKDQLLDEDPMLERMTKKRMKITMQSQYVYPTYKGSFPPNRFNVPPGYRWDGVDRSNGFESKLARRANDAEAREKAGYRIRSEFAE